MTVLADGWEHVNLFDVCRPRQWKTISSGQLLSEGYVVYGANGEIGFYSEYTHENPTLMITCRGATCGNINISKPFSYINGNAMALDDLNVAVCSISYLNYYLRSRNFEDVISGSAQPQITGEGLRKVSIPLAPINEQKRIAGKLDALLAAVDSSRARLNKVPTLIKRFRQSVLAAATSGALTEDWRGGTEATWDHQRADDICAKVQSGGTPKEGFTEEAGFPFLKTYNIVNQKVDFNFRPQFVTKSAQTGALSKSCTYPGDVLMNIVGPPLGKVAIVPNTFAEWNINQAITLFRPSSRTTSKWLYYFLCSGSSIAGIMHETKGSAGQVNISLTQCRNFLIPVPSMEEQSEIVRRVEALFAIADKLEASLAKARKRVDQLTPAILAQAFRGELVAQDPNDEPASALLARIADTAAPKRAVKKAA